MGIDSVNNNNRRNVYWCNPQESSAFDVSNVVQTNTKWTVEWSYDWSGAGCSELNLDKNTYFVVSYTAKNIETDDVFEETSTTIRSTEKPYSFSATLPNPENYGSLGVKASITISLYYTSSGGLINSVTKTHTFCNPVQATFAPDVITLASDTQCEVNANTVPVTLNLPSVTSLGRSCGQQLLNQRYITENGERKDVYSNKYSDEKSCDDTTYTYVFFANNGYKVAQSKALAVRVCRNTNPTAPTDLRSDDNEHGVSVVSGARNFVSVSWVHSVWGKLLSVNHNGCWVQHRSLFWLLLHTRRHYQRQHAQCFHPSVI